MRETVVLVGACEEYIDNLMKAKYELSICEETETCLKKLEERGLRATPIEETMPLADIIVMGVPDVELSTAAKKIGPLLKLKTIMIVLDPGVTYSDDFPRRDDVTYVVAHPCHPTFFRKQEDPRASEDFLGGIAAVQDIAIALLQGSEENFEKAEQLCRNMFAPVDRSFRVTPEQMAILEPALGEVIGCSTAEIFKEAVETAADYGVPKEAAESFLLGHVRFALAVAFREYAFEHPEAARVAINLGKQWVFTSDWKKVLEPEVIQKTVSLMLHPEKTKE